VFFKSSISFKAILTSLIMGTNSGGSLGGQIRNHNFLWEPENVRIWLRKISLITVIVSTFTRKNAALDIHTYRTTGKVRTMLITPIPLIILKIRISNW